MTNTPPTLTPVQSSNIAAIGHDGASLWVRFKGRHDEPGPLWRYHDCGAEHHDALLTTDSPGRYLLDRVRHAFRGERVG